MLVFSNIAAGAGVAKKVGVASRNFGGRQRRRAKTVKSGVDKHWCLFVTS